MVNIVIVNILIMLLLMLLLMSSLFTDVVVIIVASPFEGYFVLGTVVLTWLLHLRSQLFSTHLQYVLQERFLVTASL